MPSRLRSAALALAALCASVLACGGRGSLQTCTTSSDCPSPQSCVGGACVSSACSVGAPSCSADADCAQSQHCASGCCVAGAPGTCTSNADCAGESATPVCDPLDGSCVACVANRDCGTGYTCTSNQCVGTGGCFSNSDCRSAADPVCNVNTRTCVQCMAGSDCTNAGAPICDADHVCVSSAGCASSADCAAPTPLCSTGGQCVQCSSSSDCPAGLTCNVSQSCVQPSATTCNPESDAGTDSDCASSPSTPHCLPDPAGGSTGTCVGCVTNEECPPADVCSSNNACVPLRCSANGDCQNPAAPICDTAASPPGCVACLQNADCPNGGTCQSDDTCQAPTSACTSDSGCASNAADPHCAQVSGGTNKCVACRLAGQCGAGVTCPNDCGAGQTCGPGNLCVNVSCTGDAQCTDPELPHCAPGAGGQGGTCVACVVASQCAAGDRCDGNNTCVPICTPATQAQDCPVATPLCKVSPSGNACVACLANGDCTGGEVCSSSNGCIAPPPTGCQTSSDCPAGEPVCDTQTSPHTCVQCLATRDCPSGEVCATGSDTCQAPPEGGEGEACFSDDGCDSGLLCVDEGGPTPVCRLQCDPTGDTVCAGVSPSDVCEWLTFDSGGELIGVCEPGDGNGQIGDGCDPTQIDSCEWNLLCAPVSSSRGVCAALCQAGGACESGSCNTVLGALDDAGNPLYFGWCGDGLSDWGTQCVSDTSSSGPDCGDPLSEAGSGEGLFCTPSTLPAEYPPMNIVATCQYGPAGSAAVGGAGDSCSAAGGADCRTGLCLSDGSQTCFSGCRYNADCTRDSSSNDCFAIPYSAGSASGTVGTCEPTCRDDLDCPAGSCQPSPVFGGTSWQAICGPVSGAGKAGSACSGGAACESGVCLTASTLEAVELGVTVSGATATDGFCLGACLPAASDCSLGTTCSTSAALPLTTSSTGDLGVAGKVNPGVCFGTSCTTNASCAGLSADPGTPRVCAPFKTTGMASIDTAKLCAQDSTCAGSTSWSATCDTAANNPDPGNVYGGSAGIFGPDGKCRAISWSLECAPSLGASLGGPGAACTGPADCQTGHCISSGGASDYCFGGCASNGDCQGGTTCQTGTYLGLSSKHCMP